MTGMKRWDFAQMTASGKLEYSRVIGMVYCRLLGAKPCRSVRGRVALQD
jgi:hypothetical protein